MNTNAAALPAQLPLAIPSEHACYAGHFPGNPLVPGALLLKWIFAAVEQALCCKIVRAKQIKFLAIVKPGDHLTLEIAAGSSAAQLSLNVFARDRLIIKGTIERDHG